MRVITGTAKGRRLKEPKGTDVRPTSDMVKESVFNIIHNDVEGRRVLDLFAGSGQLGIEALSRGAAEVVFIDRSAAAVKLVKENLARCGFTARVEQTESLSFLERCGRFDLIFLDPPYDTKLVNAALQKIQNIDILTDGGIIVCESCRETAISPLTEPYRVFSERNYGKRTAICPGSFDPITLGHLNIIRRTSRIFDDVIVLVMANSGKSKGMFSIPERIDLIKRVIKSFSNVSVESYDGLLAEYAKKLNYPVIVKGLRANTDFENEFQMAQINKAINPSLDTMFLTSSEKYTFLSSSMVREMAYYGGDLSKLVPCEIIKDIEKKALLGRKMNG